MHARDIFTSALTCPMMRTTLHCIMWRQQHGAHDHACKNNDAKVVASMAEELWLTGPTESGCWSAGRPSAPLSPQPRSAFLDQ